MSGGRPTMVRTGIAANIVAGGGSLDPRHLLPVVLSMSLAVAGGLVTARRGSPLLLAGWLAPAVGEFTTRVLRALRSAGPLPVDQAPTVPAVVVPALTVTTAAFVLALAAGSHTPACGTDGTGTGTGTGHIQPDGRPESQPEPLEAV